MAAIDDLIKQIQGQGTTDKWTGGVGAEAATKDMARILDSIGITNINQFGKIPKYEPVRELYKTYNGKQVIESFDEQNNTTKNITREIIGVDEEGWPLAKITEVPKDAKLETKYGFDSYDENAQPYVQEFDQSKVKTINGNLVADTGQTTFGNKETGQAVPNTYSERQTGNAFGGTFEGKGNTGYRVDLSTGTPVFYTTGASSNDLFNLLQDNKLLNIAANVAAATFGGPLGAGALQLAQGKDLKDAAKAAALAYAGRELTNSFGGGGDASSLAPSDTSGLLDGNLGASTSGYYDEITGAFINDPLGPLQGPLTNATSGTNIGSMAGYDYDPVSGNWTTPSGEIVNTLVNENPLTNGGDIMRSAGALPPVAPVAEKAAATAAKGLGVSDAIRLAGIGAALAGGANALEGGGSGGFPIVPIPSDWTSPIKPTGTAEFTPLAPIDFGNKEMLRGTQWEQLLSPDYGKAPAMPTSTNPSNMTFNELTRILGGSTTSAPSQNLTINDVIAGIQSQYGQTPQGSMG